MYRVFYDCCCQRFDDYWQALKLAIARHGIVEDSLGRILYDSSK